MSVNKGKVLVFVDTHDRPTDIVAELNWRRTHVSPVKPSLIRDFVAKQFPNHSVVSVNYSKKAGCSCPCSPGYVVKMNPSIYDKSFWVRPTKEGVEELS